MADDTAVAVGANRRQRVNCALEAIEGVTFATHDHFKDLVIIVLANFACRHTQFVHARRYRRRCLISPTRKFSGMYRYSLSAATNNDVPATRRWRSSDLFVTRTRGPFWKPPYPSSRLFFAIVATQIAAVFMCSQGWLVRVLSWEIIGLVWAYNIGWMIAQDVVKLGLYCILDPAHSWKRSLFEPLRVPVTNTQKAVR